MANYATLKAAIQQVIKTNGNEEITGALLQQSLLAMINSLGGYYQFAGIAQPSTNPGTPDQNVFYLASTAGTYANFGSLVLADGEIAILKYNGAWSKDSTGAASLESVSLLEAKATDFESPSFTPSAGYVAVDGTIVPNYSGYTYTTPIPLQKGWLLSFEVYGGSGIAYLTKQKNGVNTPIYTTNNHPSKKFVYFADEDCNVILCSQKATSTDFGYYNILINKNVILYNHEERIKHLEHEVDGTEILFDSNNTTANYYRAKSGGIAPLSGFFYSNSIQVKKGDKFKANSVSANSAQTNVAMLSWVDSSNNFVSLILNPNGAGTYEYTFPHDGFACVSGNASDVAKFSILQSGAIFEIAILKEDVEQNSEDISDIENTINGRSFLLTLEDVTDGYYRAKSGGIAPLSGFFYSNPIPVNAGDKFKANSVSGNSAQTAIAMLSWVDSNNNFVSLILNPNGAGSYEYSFNKSGFVSISGNIVDLGKFSIEIGGVDELINNLNVRVEELENENDHDLIRLPKLTENPVEKIDYNCGLVGIFKTIGVIGDSLASGEMQGYHDDGTMYYRDMYELSWGQQIAKMTGVDVFNFSQGGQYAKGWMNGNTERTWDASGTHDGASVNLRQCYFIGFAHNDKTMVDNNTYSAGIGTIADINDSDYTQNADSYVGWYARIIQAVKSVEPRAFIFCITPPNSLFDSYTEQIRNIVEHFSGQRVYIIDLRKYGMAWDNSLLSMGNHLSSAGYLYFAYEIANYVDWIIRNNPEDFKFASLVGTDILDTNPNP